MPAVKNNTDKTAMGIITKIKREKPRKYSVFIDDVYAFFLTSTELRAMGILKQVSDAIGENNETIESPDIDISDSLAEKIEKELVIPRGERYALGLLSDRDYTVKGLEEKLIGAGYTPEQKNEIMAFVTEKGYVDDVRFALSYIRLRFPGKSRRYIETKLYLKGAEKETVKQAFELFEEELSDSGVDADEMRMEAVKKAIGKKLSPEDYSDRDKVKKAVASLVRAGFDYSDIIKAIDAKTDDF